MHTTTSKSSADQAFVITRDRAGLLAALARIDEQGWDGDAGTCLLRYVREELVRPLVIDVGLRGGAAAQAEATGWATAWEVLADPRLRRADSPWGVVWTAVRRSVLGEEVAAAYGTSSRTAWRLAGPSGFGKRTARPVSLNELEQAGWEPADQHATDIHDLGPKLTHIIDALEDVGWPRSTAERLVEAIAASVIRRSTRPTEVVGWRQVVKEVNLQPWQVRRVTVLLVGVPGWPGLVERQVTGGHQALEDPGVVAALRSTLTRWHRSPVLAARRATDGTAA